MIPQTEIERSDFSQYGEDGIIEFLLDTIRIGSNKQYIDIGAGNGIKLSNTYNLARRGFTGWVVEARRRRCAELVEHYAERGYKVHACDDRIDAAWVHKHPTGFPSAPDFLSLDIDSWDWYVLEALIEKCICPKVICVEYNANFGPDISATIEEGKRWPKKFRNLYYGASVRAFRALLENNGYRFVCCESHGSNAFFVEKDLCDTAKLDDVDWIEWADSEWQVRQWGRSIEGRMARMAREGLRLVEVG